MFHSELRGVHNSQNRRMDQAGRVHSGSSGPTFLLKQGLPRAHCKGQHSLKALHELTVMQFISLDLQPETVTFILLIMLGTAYAMGILCLI